MFYVSFFYFISGQVIFNVLYIYILDKLGKNINGLFFNLFFMT